MALAQAGLDIIVVDRIEAGGQLDAGFDGRASAIAQAPMRMLARLGVWEHLAESTPILDIRVADGASKLFLHYGHAEIGDELEVTLTVTDWSDPETWLWSCEDLTA